MTTFSGRLQSLLDRTPERVAITLQRSNHPDSSLTYTQLLRGSQGIASVLQKEGIGPGEVIILILQHGEELVYSYFGVVIHGAIPSIMPFLTEKLSPERYRADLSALISVTRPSAIVTYSAFEAEVRAALHEA